MRPGNLSSFNGSLPRDAHRRNTFKGASRFGFFGKSAMLPIPGPPPGSLPGTKVLPDAYNRKTKNYYVQNPQCPNVGERMFMCNETIYQPHPGCGSIPECCDLIYGPPYCTIDCGPPVPSECDDDADYVEFPEQIWVHCGQVIAAFAAKGIPAHFAEKVCSDEDLPDNASEAMLEKTSVTARRATGSTSRNSKGGCNPTHRPVRDAAGDYCAPCPSGQLWNGSACQQKPPPCDCNLPRKGVFGPCPPVPPSKCGPPPQHQKCNVKGWGPANLICKCNKWMCPNIRDLMMKKRPKQKTIRTKAKPRPKPRPKTRPKTTAKPKPLAGLGDATISVIPKILVASLLLGPIFYLLSRCKTPAFVYPPAVT